MAKEKIKLEILGLSSSQSQTGSFALVLGEVEGNRRLPIIIGMFEAQAIAIEIEKITPNRPMTHDLFKTFSDELSYKVIEVLISKLSEGVFYARIVCEHNGNTFEIDARPSDAIAIGLRFEASIFTFEEIMSEAGIVLSDTDDFDDDDLIEQEGEEVLEITKEDVSEEGLASIATDTLKEMLDEALKNEEYERAANIRDELSKRNA